MRIPTDAMLGNLRFTESGQVWADFILSGLTYGMRTAEEKERVRLLHQGLFRSLPGESLMLGMCSSRDPWEIYQAMMDGVDENTCPDWVAEAEATLDTLDLLRPGYRIFWLSVPLPSGIAGITLKARAARHSLERRLGLPASLPSPDVVASSLHAAQQILEAIPAPLQPQPATPAQMVWLHQHMLERGCYLDEPLPTPVTARAKRGSALHRPVLDEGGRSDDPRRGIWNPLARRYLKVCSSTPTDDGEGASYQSMMLLADVPDGEVPFPGSEMLGCIDQSGLHVDWAMRLTVTTSAEVLHRNQRALRSLNEQFNQREGELSHGLSALDRTAEMLAEYAAVMENDKLEAECQATIIVSVYDANPADVTAKSKALSSYWSAYGYRLAQPIGLQEALWWQMHPGVATSPLTREYAQLTTSATLAGLVPFADVQVGDSRGTLLAVGIDNGPMLDETTTCGPSPLIFHDPDGATDRNVSGSMAIVGDLGSGKSFTLKKTAGAILDRGGRIIVTDRTTMGEWAVWAASLTDPRVVDVSSPAWSLDPLRIFAPTVGARAAQSFLTPLLDVGPTSEQGVLLSEVLDPAYLAAHTITGLGELTDHLAADCTITGAKELARLMRVFARKDLGRIVFDNTLPPLDLAHPAIVIRTHQLALPKRAELDSEHLFRQLTIEKLFGRALFALITSIAKHECFSNLDQLAAFVVDEAHAVTSSTESVGELVDFIRDGRKHRAIVVLGSHDPDEDFPSETMRGLIPMRILMRHKDATLAANALRWLGLNPDDPTLIDLVTKDLSPETNHNEVAPERRGECIIRDATGAIGKARILPPALPGRVAAADTSGHHHQRVA